MHGLWVLLQAESNFSQLEGAKFLSRQAILYMFVSVYIRGVYGCVCMHMCSDLWTH